MQRDQAIEIVGVHRPAAATLRLTLTRTANGSQLRLLEFELLNQVRKHHRSGAILVVVIRVAEVNQRRTVAVLLAAAGIVRLSDDRGASEDL